MMVLIRDWRLFGKKWYNSYHPTADIEWCALVLHGFDEYLDAVMIWWQWGLDIKFYRVSLNLYFLV